MATTVNSAFDEFLKNNVNLDSGVVSNAKASKDWLLQKISGFQNKDFPLLYEDKNIEFGSFARKTKKRELDDIDIIIGIHGQGASYDVKSDHIEIIVKEQSEILPELCNPGTNVLNSRKLLNRLKSCLTNVPSYTNSDIKTNQQAVVLNLLTYTWAFDIVPAFFTVEDMFKKTYYLIPDGDGHWQKTDPRLDRDRVSSLNQKHKGKMLNVVRLFKYWNKRPTMPTIPSYLFENLILDYYQTVGEKGSYYPGLEFYNLCSWIKSTVYLPVQDPKGLQGDLNTLTYEEKNKIAERAKRDEALSFEALGLEVNKDYEKAIGKWRSILGSDFPTYG